MSNMFGNLSSDGLEQQEDRLGGYTVFPTGIYTGTVKMAYGIQSQHGAKGVQLILDLDGKEYRETVYVTNRNGENFFLNKQDASKKVPLPGFTTINDICAVTTELALADQDVEEKMVKVYDTNTKTEVPKAVPTLVNLLGKTVSVAINENIENKTVQQNGKYVPVAEERRTNTIEKVFHTESKMTVAELMRGDGKADFWDKWAEKYTGQARDKRTIKDGQGGAPGRPGVAPAAGATAPKRSLFGNKG